MSFLGIGNTPQAQFSPAGFSSGGLSGTFSGGKYNLSESPTLAGNVGALQQTFGKQAAELGTLRGTVAPGFSQFRQAGMGALENQRLGTISNLRDTLAQRRVLGSSFAQNTISNTEAEFAQQEAQFQAQSYLQELEATNQLINQQYQAGAQAYSTAIGQSNIEAGIAANLTSSANSALANIATVNAQLQAQSQAGLGKLIGVGAALAAAPFTGGASLAAIPAITGSGGTINVKTGGAGGGSGGGYATSPLGSSLSGP